MSSDFRKDFTAEVIDAIASGSALPWEKPWHTMHGLPRNALSNKLYTGGNVMTLSLASMSKGYTDPRWLTFNQALKLEGSVGKGEKGVTIERREEKLFWRRSDVSTEIDGKDVKVLNVDAAGAHLSNGEIVSPHRIIVEHENKKYSWLQAQRNLNILAVKNHVVFNVEQCKNLKLAPLEEDPARGIPIVERAEQLIAAMKADGVRFVHTGFSASYSPAGDIISMPPRESFESVEGYYGTALHEIGHATGAQHRLNREGITGGHRFGSDGYAREELRAELFSAFIAAETGIPHEDNQHKAYLQSWARVLKADKNEIFRAAAEAGKAVDYVLAKERDLMQQIDRAHGQVVGPNTMDLSKAPHELTWCAASLGLQAGEG